MDFFKQPFPFILNSKSVKIFYFKVNNDQLISFISHLGVAYSPDNFTVLLHLVEISLNILLASIIVPLLGSFGERLLLGAVP